MERREKNPRFKHKSQPELITRVTNTKRQQEGRQADIKTNSE